MKKGIRAGNSYKTQYKSYKARNSWLKNKRARLERRILKNENDIGAVKALEKLGAQIEIKDGYVYINGEKNILPDRAKLQFKYIIDTQDQRLNIKNIEDRFGLRELPQSFEGKYVFTLTEEEAEKLKSGKQRGPNRRSVRPLHSDCERRNLAQSLRYASLWPNKSIGEGGAV